MDLIFPDWIAPDTIGALSTTRKGGVSHPPYDDGIGQGGLNLAMHVGDRWQDVEQNRAQLRALLPSEPVWLSQIHGVNVVDAAQGLLEADASFTTQRGVVCVVQTADCLPVLFCDAAGQVVGAAHAGWRGLLHGVLENTVTCMRHAGAMDILAWLGPAIGPQQFEVGEDVMLAFIKQDARAGNAFKPRAGYTGKYLANIVQLARDRLNQLGVNKIYGGQYCTVGDSQRFYSYRRDQVTGRMASFIWLK